MANDKGTADGIPAELDKGALDILEARSRIAKLALEQEKLQLEQQALTRSLSRQGWLMEWLKAGAVPVTLLGATLAFYVGFGQLQQTEENRVSDRFDKALTRLASDKQNERISGILQLRLFLKDEDPSRQTAAMQSLVNAASVETNTLIQASILDAFGDLQSQKPSQTALDEGLRIALQRNRSLRELILANSATRIELEVERREQTLTTTPSLQALSKVLDAKHPRFFNLPPTEDVPLEGLKRIISDLVNNGAGKTYKDFTGIYCRDCDFSKASHLAGANFGGALINGANFSKVDLQGASFQDADLSGAFFVGANLTGADLSQNSEKAYGSYLDMQVGALPLLACAKLQGANLSGRLLALLTQTFSDSRSSEAISVSHLRSAEIDTSTKMENFRVVAVTFLDDAYLSANADERLRSLMSYAIKDPARMEYNTQGGYTVFYDSYWRTRVVRYEAINAKSKPNDLNWPKAALHSLLNESNWTKLPAVSNFTEALDTPSPTEVTVVRPAVQTGDCSSIDQPKRYRHLWTLDTYPAPYTR